MPTTYHFLWLWKIYVHSVCWQCPPDYTWVFLAIISGVTSGHWPVFLAQKWAITVDKVPHNFTTCSVSTILCRSGCHWQVPASARDTCNRCGAVKQGLSGDIFGMIGGNGPSHSGRGRWAFYRFETWEEHSWNWRRIRKIFRNASKEFDTLVECDHLCLFKETPVNVSKKATCVKFALYWAVFSWSCALWVSYIGLLKCYHVYQSQWIHKEVDTTHICGTRKCYLIICIKRQAQIPAIYVSKELWPRKCVGKC